jgi:hypothetical protein
LSHLPHEIELEGNKGFFSFYNLLSFRELMFALTATETFVQTKHYATAKCGK